MNNNHHWTRLKHLFRIGVIEVACILIFLAITYESAQGLLTLYRAYYTTGNLPNPDVFQAASLQFTAAISLIYMLHQTRKHRPPETEEQK
jgi:hypothetical protein